MSKRKVTDLLPTEAILISSEADLKVLEEFEKAGIVWYSSRRKPTEYNPPFPFHVRYSSDLDGLVVKYYPTDYKIVAASDFIPTEPERGFTIVNGKGEVFSSETIPTEAEKVEVDWKKVAEELNAELEKVAEFFRTYNKPDNTFGSFVSKQIDFTELAESVNQTFLKTRSEKVEVGEIDLSKLTRYDLGYCSGSDGICTAEMKECTDGDYVLWSDIEQLLKTRNTPNQ